MDGQRVGDAGHGVTLTRLDAQGRLVSSRTFNTHQHTERSHEFLSQLTELPQMMAAGERLYLSTQGSGTVR
ncbi:hypothetical protein G3U99_13445 [Vibrio coralliilyticus OCN008]|uniref:hypothetical protein n=1 Tax=Vibrio coralliilyticus TaxID=190893 RepID=UPI0013F3CFA9|nr:hypothetical protein [Vibrio coralliilyticus]QIJ84739.1 hypothetical protein G3U99_10970 [Vibrio coralliilyticus OCN008]QIJ85203.1 hypothetical protein G3U99_13445 [Vibrio coralliilyticus OCN008]